MMNKQINILYIWTRDNLRLQGIHYKPMTKGICVLFVHGMSGNFIENYFTQILGEELSSNNISFIYGHNRGYNHINDIIKRDSKGTQKTVRIGATYERFTESVFDIDAWLEIVRELGYKKIILMGHSLGCNKIICYLSQKKSQDIIGVIFASPPDMVGLFEKPEYQPNHKQLLAEAVNNIKEGNPRKLVSGIIWDWYHLSSQTYFDLSERNGVVDNLPLLRNPDKFEQLAQIKAPILGIMGDNDDIAIRTLEKDLDLIALKATGCKNFKKVFIRGANHTYNMQEKALTEVVLNWINKPQT